MNCPACAGVGRFVDDGAACDGCDGTGYADETAQRVAVRLNAQVAAGDGDRFVPKVAMVVPVVAVEAKKPVQQRAMWDFTPKGKR
jgi:hypothetical protein